MFNKWNKVYMSKDKFIELAESRYSVRSYSQRNIEENKMSAILRAGQVAPTAANRQPQKIYVLQSADALRKIRAVTKSVFDAPAVMLVCYDSGASWKRDCADGHDCGEMDATIVCTHMMLEAWSLGIGSCWVMLFDPQQVAEAFALPANIRPVCLLAMGYPAEEARPSAMHGRCRPLAETVERI